MHPDASTINPTRPVRSLVKILLGLALITTGVALILPALAKLELDGAIPQPIVLLLIYGNVITTCGAWILLQSIVVRAPQAAK